MRRRWLLAITLGALGEISCPVKRESTEGLIPIDSSGGGATLVASGVLTPNTFVLESLRVVGSPMASRSTDPDQFRVTLQDAHGRELETVRMWSPLSRFQWDEPRQNETVRTLEKRRLDIPIAASLDLEYVVLSWPDGKVVARLNVRQAIRDFCAKTPANPACRPGRAGLRRTNIRT